MKACKKIHDHAEKRKCQKRARKEAGSVHTRRRRRPNAAPMRRLMHQASDRGWSSPSDGMVLAIFNAVRRTTSIIGDWDWTGGHAGADRKSMLWKFKKCTTLCNNKYNAFYLINMETGARMGTNGNNLWVYDGGYHDDQGWILHNYRHRNYLLGSWTDGQAHAVWDQHSDGHVSHADKIWHLKNIFETNGAWKQSGRTFDNTCDNTPAQFTYGLEEGFSRSVTNSFAFTSGFSVTLEKSVGAEAKGLSASTSMSMTMEMSQTIENSVTDTSHLTSTVQVEFEVPPHQCKALYQLSFDVHDYFKDADFAYKSMEMQKRPCKGRCNTCPGSETLSGTRDKGYRGCQTVTRTGKTCQNWQSQAPHEHSFGGATQDGVGDHNYCRNPSWASSGSTIWCYTTDEGTRWDYCDPISTA